MNSGKATRAALKMILWSLLGLAVLFAASWVGHVLGSLVIEFYQVFFAVWLLFAIFVLYLCRDPRPVEPNDPRAIVSPAHGTVDVIEETVESEFVQGVCQRISISLSLLDVQVQYAPVSAKVARFEHHFSVLPGRKSAVETLTIGLQPLAAATEKMLIRVAAGTWGRRILPWLQEGDELRRSQRLGMTRAGSRVDFFLPRGARPAVRVGDRVVGGQSIVARWDEGYG